MKNDSPALPQKNSNLGVLWGLYLVSILLLWGAVFWVTGQKWWNHPATSFVREKAE